MLAMLEIPYVIISVISKDISSLTLAPASTSQLTKPSVAIILFIEFTSQAAEPQENPKLKLVLFFIKTSKHISLSEKEISLAMISICFSSNKTVSAIVADLSKSSSNLANISILASFGSSNVSLSVTFALSEG